MWVSSLGGMETGGYHGVTIQLSRTVTKKENWMGVADSRKCSILLQLDYLGHPKSPARNAMKCIELVRSRYQIFYGL